jgi:hypothetical protein
VLFPFKCGLASKAGLRHLSWNNSGGSATIYLLRFFLATALRMSFSLQLQKEAVLLILVLQLTLHILISFFLYLDSKGSGRGWE